MEPVRQNGERCYDSLIGAAIEPMLYPLSYEGWK